MQEMAEGEFAGKRTDGWANGVKLFQSKPNRGVFLALSALHHDKRQLVCEWQKIIIYLKNKSCV